MRILAVDPGYGRTGIAVLESETRSSRPTLIYSSCFTTESRDRFGERLRIIGKEIERVITLFEPSALAIERLFFNTNQATAFAVAEARGVVILKAADAGLMIYEYTPLQVKIAITGYGRGTKSQVKNMTNKLIDVEKPVKHDDEYDAIAVGLTCLASVPNNTNNN